MVNFQSSNIRWIVLSNYLNNFVGYNRKLYFLTLTGFFAERHRMVAKHQMSVYKV